MQHLQPNTTLQGGKYKIQCVLGQGGFGITYLATQTSLQRNVAVKEFFMKDLCGRDEETKMMSTPSTGSSKLVEQYRKKFTKEARNLARLSHSHIISVIDVFEENGTAYYVMPYLSGGSLQDYVEKHGALSETEAMKYVRQIASALKYMHEEQHICHYDVKPANILLGDKGNAVLIDFGLSKNYDTAGHETTTTPIGVSEGYAPIEQYQQDVEEFSPASDVYALGATLYFLLHGQHPVSAILRASGTALPMSSNLSSGIRDIIISSMKLAKNERAQNMNVFLYSSPASISSSRKTNNSYIGWIIGLAGLIIGVFVFKNPIFMNKASLVVDSIADSIGEQYTDSGITAYSDTVGADQENEAKINKSIQLSETKSAYAQIIDKYEVMGRNNDYWGLYYFLYDITEDGIPELWIQANNEDDPHNLDGILLVYSYNNGQIHRLFKGDNGHPYHHSFYKGKDYIIMDFAHMDSQAWTKYIYIDGYIYEREVASTKKTNKYKTPLEQEIETYEVTDKSPIENMSL